jgi:hypothetical protein
VHISRLSPGKVPTLAGPPSVLLWQEDTAYSCHRFLRFFKVLGFQKKRINV